MGSIFKPKLPPPPPVPEPPEAPTELSAEEKEKIRQDQLRRDRKRTGRRSTILTGPMGVEEEAEIGKKTLLGE